MAAVIQLSFTVAGLSRVLQNYDRIKVYRSTAGMLGPYTELTTQTTRIPLVSNQIVYPFQDPGGDPAYFYKCSYFSTLTGAESNQSDAQAGAGDPALNIVSIASLKTNYLVGLDLTTPQGIPFPDSLYEFYIKAATSWIERKLDIPLRTRIIVDETYDYYREEYYKFIYTRLNTYPVISVQAVRLVLPGNQVTVAFDPTWIHLRQETGELQILPGVGVANLPVLGATGGFLPYLSSSRYIPDVIHVDYTAGFSGTFPEELTELVAKVASFGPLNIAGDLLGGAGIASQSIGIDGLSQSINTTSSPMFAGYGARLTQYNKEIKDQIPTLRRYYKGIGMRVA